MGYSEEDFAAMKANQARARGAVVAATEAIPRTALAPQRLVIYGAPRTKKNSQVHATDDNGKVTPLPSKAWRQWLATCRVEPYPPPRMPDARYNIAALFYRDRDVGDSHNYYEGLADLLQAKHGGKGVVSDDKHFVTWDGSRLLKDADNPRVEVLITLATDDGGAS